MRVKSVFDSFVHEWKHHQAPARPMASELVLIEEYIKSLPKGKLLVLGATPEYRDIGIKHGWETNALDINTTMLVAMEELMQYAQDPLNKKVAGDWCVMPFKDGEFNCILAEQSLNMIPKENGEEVLQECRRVLSAEGTALLKTQVISLDFHISVKEATNRYLQNEISFNDYVMYVMHSSDGGCYNEGVLSLKKDAELIANMVAKGEIPQAIQDLHKKQYAAHYSEHKLYLQPEDQTEAQVKKYFNIEKIMRGTDFEMARVMPIYVCKKLL